jgi:phosphate-selective porin OprO and OprP
MLAFLRVFVGTLLTYPHPVLAQVAPPEAAPAQELPVETVAQPDKKPKDLAPAPATPVGTEQGRALPQPVPAPAQPQGAGVEAKQVAAAVVVASKEGFSIGSADKDFVLKLRGYAQGDARLFMGDRDETPPHTFVLRRVRPILEGTLYEYFGFRVMPDFGGGQATVQDAHLDVRPLKEISLRFGKFKAPFSLERLQSATNLLFVERGFTTSLAPNRDIGVQVYGELWGGTVNYAAGVFNGVPDGGSADVDIDHDKDVVARVFLHPLRPLEVEVLDGLGLGVAVSTGSSEGVLATPNVAQYRTSGQQAFFRYRSGEAIDATVVAGGTRSRVSPQLYYFYGPLGLHADYTASRQRVTLDGSSKNLRHQAWQVAGTFAIAGTVSYEGVKPSSAVGDGGTGAFELALRYQGFRADRDAFPTFANPDAAARDATGLGAGLGWWPNRNVRFMANYEATAFDGGAADGGDRLTERAVLIRSQVSW